MVVDQVHRELLVLRVLKVLLDLQVLLVLRVPKVRQEVVVEEQVSL